MQSVFYPKPHIREYATDVVPGFFSQVKGAITPKSAIGALYIGMLGMLLSDLIPTPADGVFFAYEKNLRDRWTRGKLTPKQFWFRSAASYYLFNAAWWSLVIVATAKFGGNDIRKKLVLAGGIIGGGAVAGVIFRNIKKDKEEYEHLMDKCSECPPATVTASAPHVCHHCNRPITNEKTAWVRHRVWWCSKICYEEDEGADASWKHFAADGYECPKCHIDDELFVISCTVTGNMSLHDDGFNIDGDTSDEQVICRACNFEGSIGEFVETDDEDEDDVTMHTPSDYLDAHGKLIHIGDVCKETHPDRSDDEEVYESSNPPRYRSGHHL